MHGGSGTHHHHHHHHHAHADQEAVHGPGHNHPHDHDHLHLHPHGQRGPDRMEELATLGAAFIDGFRQAADKTSYLRLAGIAFEREGADGLSMKLVDAAFVSNWQLGTASPGFGSRELVYLPYPGAMVSARETMSFTYVSLTQRADIDLLALLGERMDAGQP